MMSESTSWPRRFPKYTALGFLMSFVVLIGLVKIWSFQHPTQWFYLPEYIKTSIPGRSKPTRLRVLQADGSTRYVYAVPREYSAVLARTIYGNEPLYEVFDWPLVGFLVCLSLAFGVGGYYDGKYNREARKGRLLRGPKLIGWREFRRLTKGDGLRFQCAPGETMAIRLDREAHHIQVAGDTGSGKTTIVRDILYQVEERGEVAIIFDPDREYIREFFDESRGDWVLNPKDERCPYWPIGEEAADEAEATPIANGLFPDGPTVQKFFLNHTRAIFAFLLAEYRPSVAELAHWMAHPEEIDQRVAGTEHEHTLTANAAPQRAGILGSLNEAGKPLRMMPGPEGRRVWTAKDWAEKRQGWLFITSTPDTLDALRPLQSLWLDMLVLKIQTADQNPKRVWMILDEVAALNQLPQLHSALTRQRKSNNPIVLGFQGMSQIEFLYGDKMAQTILSQAFTNVILRTRESKAAHHLSELIGKQELERLRENRPASLMGIRGWSYSTEKVVVPVVMESEIQGLDDLRGYFVQLNKVVKIAFMPRTKRNRAVGLVERMIPPVRQIVVVDETPQSDEMEAQVTYAPRKVSPWRGSTQVDLFDK